MLRLLILTIIAAVSAFTPTMSRRAIGHSLTMEYIPDGMTKAQWDKIKEEERKKNEGKDLGKVGITKFKSRSFEAWQKAGGKHLFPVDSSTPVNERPYMQRLGGSWDASDIRGAGKGQAAPQKLTAVDKKYIEVENKKPEPVIAADKNKKQAAPAAKTAAKAPANAASPEPKKKLFGLF